MKKYFKISLIYAIVALAMGVFYREFTKAKNVTYVTSLSKIHLHLFVLGTIMFILIAILSNYLDYKKSKIFKPAIYIYNSGLIVTCIMFLVRGIMQVIKSEKNTAMISGFAGVGHALLGIGIVMLLLSFIFLSKENKKVVKK